KIKTLASLDPSLVGYWDMETTTLSGSQMLLKDWSGYGNNGVCYNGGTPVTCDGGSGGPQIVDGKGKSGKAMSFDGVDDWIKVKNDPKISFSGSITLVAKIQLNKICTVFFDGDPCIDSILWKGGAHNSGFWLMANYRDSKFLTEINMNNGGYGHISATTHNLLSTNIVFVKNNTSNAYYINGILDSNKTTNYLLLNNTDDLSIGSAFAMKDRVFDGLIDEVRIYNRALSDSEIKTLYNATK
ncbi:MAG: LamG domain-containing protein, partial [Candidatus Gracilibacteria bacterium]|nr:LamG domain-containing protein [Candidatus Gracilibacteria bacterium]